MSDKRKGACKLLLGVLLALLIQGCTPAMAAQFSESNIIKALAGEAGGQSMQELVAHAHAIANRGHLRGVYGLKAKVSPRSLEMAKKAYAMSRLLPDSVGGSDHWLSDYDLKHSRESLIAWRHKVVYSIKVGSTTFYKLK